MAPEGEERVGDVSNVLFSNGWIADEDGSVFIYYASSDTRLHVATSTIDKLVDYITNTPQDGYLTGKTVVTLNNIIDKNMAYTTKQNNKSYAMLETEMNI
jgi:4-O-beta-D-mannosyl-D-glucose phosphorylase